MDAPEVRRDLERADAYCIAFEEEFKGKLAALAGGSGASERLSEVVKRYEMIDDLIGRLISYAGLVYAGNTSDPTRAKFYGDVQERITAASSHLLFFTLELNRIEDDVLQAAMRDGPLARYQPWLTDVRREKPYQLEDRVEQLFHEKSVTTYGAWNRLFDETIAGLRFQVGGEKLALEQTLNLMQDPREPVRKQAAQALARTFGANLRVFTLITNTLAKDKEISDRWRGFADVASSRHLANRVEPEVVEALVTTVRAAYPRLSHRYYALKANGSVRPGSRIGTAMRPSPRSRAAPSAGPRHARPCCRPMGHFRPAWRRSPSAFSTSVGSMPPHAPARPRGRSRIQRCRPPIRMCCSTTRVSRVT